jgi:hypothetical protein
VCSNISNLLIPLSHDLTKLLLPIKTVSTTATTADCNLVATRLWRVRITRRAPNHSAQFHFLFINQTFLQPLKSTSELQPADDHSGLALLAACLNGL